MSKTVLFTLGGLVLAGILFQMLARVPTDALNVALGVMCGIGASIPVSVGLLLALTRHRESAQDADWQDPEREPQVITRPAQPVVSRVGQPTASFVQPPENAPVPQVIFVAAAPGQFAPGQFPQGTPVPLPWMQQLQYPFMQEQVNAVDAREWRIIGEE